MDPNIYGLKGEIPLKWMKWGYPKKSTILTGFSILNLPFWRIVIYGTPSMLVGFKTLLSIDTSTINQS